MSSISKSQKKLLFQLLEHEQQSPLVCKLNKKIKKLKYKNKLLNNVILRFGELSPNMVDLTHSDSDDERIGYSIEENIVIKEEPFDIRANTNIGSDETKQYPSMPVGPSYTSTQSVTITDEEEEEEESAEEEEEE